MSKAQESWKGNQSVRGYLQSIEQYTKQDKIDILYVIDNGKGFDERGLEAVLAEGAPEKQDGAAGSFGIGHLTTFGLSGLQYIFYLGKNQAGKLIAAGHAILSSYENDKGELRSAHGYFVRDHKQTFQSPYVYCEPEEIPQFLLAEADKLPHSGSIVAVLGFKGFQESAREDENRNRCLRNTVCQAVAENFAMAICSKRLTVNVQTADGESTPIDQTSIMEFLEWMSQSDTGSRESTREARQTLEAIRTYQSHDAAGSLTGQFGDCHIRMRNKAPSHNISIWRNGMLITRRYLGLAKNQFDGKKPLNATILLSGKENPRVAHDIVKKAETPLHDRIQSKRLPSKGERETLKSLMGEIRNWIRANADDSGGESKYLDDEILIDAGHTGAFRTSSPPRVAVDDDDGEGDTPWTPGETPPSEKSSTSVNESRTGAEGRRGKRTVTKANHTPILAQGRVTNDGYRVRIQPNQSADKAVLEILVDPGQDPSCVGTIDDRDLIVSEAWNIIDSQRELLKIKEGRVLLPPMKEKSFIVIDLVFDSPLPNNVSLQCRVGKL